MLETCVKNCGHRFHVLLAKREFLDEIVKILSPKVGIHSNGSLHSFSLLTISVDFCVLAVILSLSSWNTLFC